nr:reverse transcriptase domain-containing protein, chloroplastic [Tanacetum cinerariifolium]
VKAVEEICVTCGGAHLYYQCLASSGNTFSEYWDNIQGYVSAAIGNYNQGNPGYHPQGVANQIRPPGFAQPNVQNNQNRFGQPQGFNLSPNFNQEQPCQATQSNQNFHLNELEKIKRMNDVSLNAMQNQIDMVKNELRNEMKTSIQTSLSNQTNEIKNMMVSLLQMNIASTSGSGTLPGNTIANPKGKLKAITTRSGLVTKGPTVPNLPKFVNPEEDECVEETYTDLDHVEYTIKELANTPLNENCSAIIVKKLPEKLEDPGKFLIPCGFSELKCKALADLGANINLMPLSVWKKLGLPDLIPTLMTLKLANRAICIPDGIARDVFVPVGKFTFSADFIVVDYESDHRVPLLLGRPFLRTARALIYVHGKEMILRDGDERLTLNMKHDTASNSNHPYRDSVNLINIFNLSKMFTDEQPPDYSFPLRFDVYPDDFLEIESDATFDDDYFDSEGEKIKEAELLIDPLDLPCDILSEYDSFNSQDFSRDDVLPSPDNEDKVKEILKKGQNWIKTRQKREAWQNREMLEAVTVDRARKTEENAKRRATNAKSIQA